MKRIYEWLFYAAPWVVAVELFHYHFQSFLGYPGFLRGPHAFDLFTGTDIYVTFLVVVFALGFLAKKIKLNFKALPKELLVAGGLLLLAGALQIFVSREMYEPILSTPYKYFRSMFFMPLLLVFLIFTTLDKKAIKGLVTSYFAMMLVFSLVALAQYYITPFVGESKDFMDRLVWPYVDIRNLHATSANWMAFVMTPAVIFSFIEIFRNFSTKKWQKHAEKWVLPLFVFILSGWSLFLTQSYGAYVAVFAALVFYLFRFLSFKRFLVAGIIALLVAGGVYWQQTTTWKFQVLQGDPEYRYANSAVSRMVIYRMGLHVVQEFPLMGVGLNQFQSYFAQNQAAINEFELEPHLIPPHAHNFFLSMWTNLGVLAPLAFAILVLGLFWRTKFDPRHPAVFVIVAIMLHGLIDSWYWKQEIAYIFWLMAALAYLYKTEKTTS